MPDSSEPAMPPTQELVTHNYAAWNQLIDTYVTEINRRGRLDRSHFYMRLAFGTAIMILAIGVVIALILWSLPTSVRVVRPQVIQVPTTKIVQAPPNPKISVPAPPVPSPPVPSPSMPVPPPSEPQIAVHGFVMFTTRPITGTPFKVTTGHSYDNPQDWTNGKPNAEWCYIDIPRVGARSNEIYIESKTGNSPPVFDNGWEDAVRQIDLQPDTVANLCDF